MSDFLSLFTNIWGILMVLVFFGGSIFVHELGHYLAARWRGAKVERFSIGFGPRLFGWTDKNGVDWRISLLPLGGYVALPQLADMRAIEGGNENEQEKLPKLTFSDRFYILVAGAFFNVLFAIALSIIVWIVGRPAFEREYTTTIGVVSQQLPLSMVREDPEMVPGPARLAGLQPGDRILEIDGTRVDNWEGVSSALILGGGRDAADNPSAEITFERAGELQTLSVKPRLVEINPTSGDQMRQIGIFPAERLLVTFVTENSPAARAGLQPGDVIKSVDGQDLFHLQNFIEYLAAHPDKTVELSVRRDEATVTLTMQPQLKASRKPLAHFAPAIEEGAEAPEPVILRPLYGADENGRLLAEGDPGAPDTPSRLQVFRVPDTFPLAETLEPTDVIVSVNGEPYTSLADFVAKAQTVPEDQPLPLEIQKGGRGGTVEMKMPISYRASVQMPEKRPIVGFIGESPRVRIYPDPAEQFEDNVDRIFSTLGGLINPQSDVKLRHLSGPVGIGRALHNFFAEFGWDEFLMGLYVTVLLNVNLAILNLLPIPVLDGGHLVYALIEKLRGKSLPPNWVAGTQGAFAVMILGLMAYIIIFDVLRWHGDTTSSPQEQMLRTEPNSFSPQFSESES
ncbi:MAG: RIP metalloprotease RseP [Opitutales bacterium]